MPTPSKIEALPADVRAQLDQQLAAAGFRGCIAASNWLRSVGHPVGKSAVAIHARRLKAQAAEPIPGAATGLHGCAVRLACLDVAARLHGTGATGADWAIEAASKMEAWVLGAADRA